MSHAWVLETRALEKVLQDLGFRADSISALQEAARKIAADPVQADEFADFATKWFEGGPKEPSEKLLGLWDALAVVAAFPHLIASHKELNVPLEITAATARDLQRRMDDYQDRFGMPGFDRLMWMRHHVTSKLYEIGRLQYMQGKFIYPYRVYKETETPEGIPLAHGGMPCTPAGWPRDDANAFVTEFSVSPAKVIGHKTDEFSGAISAQQTVLPGDARLLLDDQSDVLHIHIPAGEKLRPEECVDSLQRAQIFFKTCYPKIPCKAFCCRTWMLDRALAEVLPAHSNILSFGQLFRPIAVKNATHDQHLERIFGTGVDWQTFVPQTSLQQAVISFLKQGGQFRLLAGYRLFDKVPG